MKELELKENIDKQEIVEKKRHELTLLGKGRKPFKNAKLFSKDNEGKIEEVVIEKKEHFVISLVKEKKQDTQATSKVTIDPKKQYIWALNINNAKRKLNNNES